VNYVADAVTFSGSSTFKSKALATYKVNGVQKGTLKTVDNFTFLRVFGAGHEVMYYQPEVSLQVFTQMMFGKPITST
jgi:carboxypeptidase C (cathepsin A)